MFTHSSLKWGNYKDHERLYPVSNTAATVVWRRSCICTGKHHATHLANGKRDWKLRWFIWQPLQFETECIPLFAAERDLHAVGLKCYKYFDFFSPRHFSKFLSSTGSRLSNAFWLTAKASALSPNILMNFWRRVLLSFMSLPFSLYTLLGLCCYTCEPTVKKARHESNRTLGWSCGV